MKKTLLLLLASAFILSGCGQAGPQGPKGDPGQNGINGEKGNDGVSVVSIIKTSSSELVDTYTITYSNGTTSTFTVTNGKNGEQGIEGKPGDDGVTPTISINQLNHWVINGIDTGINATGPKGDAGDDGASFLNGTTDPLNSVGKDGDCYLNTTTNDVFSKDDGEWTKIGNLQGAEGKSAYETYKEYHPDYDKTEEEWINEFCKKDDTDYTKYGDFVFNEVTYGGVVGYAANYIGNEEIVSYPETFKNLPVLLATIDDSSFAPHYDRDDILPTLEKIYLPSTIKVVSISEGIKNRYDVSQVTPYVYGSFDRFDVPFYPNDVYFVSGGLEEYRETNLRKYFTFSNIFVNNGDSYMRAINRDDTINEFLNTKYRNEGGLEEQILEALGGSDEFYKLGSFEYKFPKKYVVNFDGYDINIPLNFFVPNGGFRAYPGVSFEDNILTVDETRFGKINGYDIDANVDIGIRGYLLTPVTFHLYKTPTHVKLGDDNVLTELVGDKIYSSEEIELTQGTYDITLFYEDEVMLTKFPLKPVKGIDVEIKHSFNYTSLVIKEDGTYCVSIDLNNFELEITENGLIFSVSSLLLEPFKLENGFLEETGTVISRKQLTLPSTRKIEHKGIKYDVALKYSIGPSDCVVDKDSDHPTIYYNKDVDESLEGYNKLNVKFTYTLGDSLIGGHFIYTIFVYDASSIDNAVDLKLYIDNSTSKTIEMILDIISDITNPKYKLNDVEINATKFSINTNGCEGTYVLKEGSKGEIVNGYYNIEPGKYNLTIDINSNSLLIEESDGASTKIAKKAVFDYLIEKGFNLYVGESEEDVVMFTKPSKIYLGYEFDFEYKDVWMGAQFEILENLDMHYSITDKDDSKYAFNIGSSFIDFEKSQEMIVKLKVDSLFLNFHEITFAYTLRHSPDVFKIGGVEPRRDENNDNIYYLDNFTLSEKYIDLTLEPNGGERPGTFKYAGGSGKVPSFSYNQITVPDELINHVFNFVFDMNTMTVYAEEVWK